MRVLLSFHSAAVGYTKSCSSHSFGLSRDGGTVWCLVPVAACPSGCLHQLLRFLGDCIYIEYSCIFQSDDFWNLNHSVSLLFFSLNRSNLVRSYWSWSCALLKVCFLKRESFRLFIVLQFQPFKSSSLILTCLGCQKVHLKVALSLKSNKNCPCSVELLFWSDFLCTGKVTMALTLWPALNGIVMRLSSEQKKKSEPKPSNKLAKIHIPTTWTFCSRAVYIASVD